MTEDIIFKDCEFRYIGEYGELQCKNKQGLDSNLKCDNCAENIHLSCINYNPKKDMCLKWFEENVSEHHDTCNEKATFSDKELSRKWSN